MPKILDKRVQALKRKGMSEDRAWAVATSQLQKEGKLKKGSHRRKK